MNTPTNLAATLDDNEPVKLVSMSRLYDGAHKIQKLVVSQALAEGRNTTWLASEQFVDALVRTSLPALKELNIQVLAD